MSIYHGVGPFRGGVEINYGMFVGNIGRWTECKKNKLDRWQCFLHVAQSQYTPDGEGGWKEQKPLWVDFVAYEATAKIIEAKAVKGARVLVVYKLDSWRLRGKGNRTRVQCHALKVWFMETTAESRIKSKADDDASFITQPLESIVDLARELGVEEEEEDAGTEDAG